MRSDVETEVTVWDKPVSWGAIVGGAVVAISVQVVLTLLGLGLGLVAARPEPVLEEPSRAAAALGAGAVAWWFITGLGSLFFGGWVAGRLSAIPMPVRGMLHGLISWGLVNIASLFFLTTAAGVLLGGGLGALVDDLSPSKVSSITEQAQRGTEQARQALTQEEGRRAVDQARKASAGGAIVAFFALLLGALSASMGGALATRHGGERGRGEAAHRTPAAAGAR